MTEFNYAEKIAKLLAKAEGNTTPAEAEACLATAQKLMIRHGISEALVDAARGVERDEIEQRELVYVGFLRKDMGLVGSLVARLNGCRAVYDTVPRTLAGGRRYTEVYALTVTGFRSDLARVEQLDSSLRIQAASATATWWNERKVECEHLTNHERNRERQEFVRGFVAAVAEKLERATRAGRAAAVADEAERAGVSDDAADTSVALVLRSRKDRVDDWMDAHYGKLRRGSGRSYLSGSAAARESGHAAGRRADVGQPRVGGQRELPS